MTLDHAAALHAQMLAIVQTDQSDAECVTAMEDLLDAVHIKPSLQNPIIWGRKARCKPMPQSLKGTTMKTQNDTRVDATGTTTDSLTASLDRLNADLQANVELVDKMNALWLDRIREAYREGFHDAEQMLKEAIGQVDMNANRGFRFSVSASYGKALNADAVDPSGGDRNA